MRKRRLIITANLQKDSVMQYKVKRFFDAL